MTEMTRRGFLGTLAAGLVGLTATFDNIGREIERGGDDE